MKFFKPEAVLERCVIRTARTHLAEYEIIGLVELISGGAYTEGYRTSLSTRQGTIYLSRKTIPEIQKGMA